LAAIVTESDEAELKGPGVVEFKTSSGGSVATDHRLSKVALSLLGKAWPRAIAFTDLTKEALRISFGNGAATRNEAEVDALADVLFRAFCNGVVHLHRTPPRLTTVVSERPRASELARWQATRLPLVTNLLHCSVQLEGPIARAFLPLVDGTRTVDELVGDLKASLARQGLTGAGTDARHEVARPAVENSLNLLGKLGLLLD
jgi:hypothetical protein